MATKAEGFIGAKVDVLTPLGRWYPCLFLGPVLGARVSGLIPESLYRSENNTT